MKSYLVKVGRTAYGRCSIRVEARNEEEAVERAIEMAGDHDFSCYDADYHIETVKEA